MAENLHQGGGFRWGAVSVLALAGLILGCGDASVESGGETGLHVALVVPRDATEITSVFFEVRNNLGEVRQALFSLEEEPFLCLIDPGFAGHACADWLVRLEPGDYAVAATPLTTGGAPSHSFAPARGIASVFPGATTEIVLSGSRFD